MPRERTYSGMIGDLEQLIAALLAYAVELPQWAGVRLHLGQILALTPSAFPGQTALIAGQQDASLRLPHQIGGGQRQVTAIREMLKAYHSRNAEKLAKLDIQPPRSRSRRTASGLPPPEEPAPIPEIPRPPDTYLL